ncbi:MAG: late control protein, partial [Pseudomonadota bacterium]
MRPTYALRVDGVDLGAMVRTRLLSMSVTDVSGIEADRLEFVIDDADDIALPRRGVLIEPFLGYDGRSVPVGRFVVDGVSVDAPPRRLTVRGRSADLTA